MATRIIRGSSTTTVRSRKFKAKVEANQPLVDIIGDKRERCGQSNYAHTLGRAMTSLVKAKSPITSYEEAIALSGIGPSIASMLFEKELPVPKRKRSKKASSAESSDGGSVTSSAQKRPPGSSLSVPSTTTTTRTPSKRPRPNPEHIQTMLHKKEPPSRKEQAYQKALREADSWKGQKLVWRLVLLIDQRERKAEHYSSKVQQCGIPTEIRTLPIGDMTWIAQGMDSDDRVVAELMLGTILERKEVKDLKASLFGTRYNEQQLRLKDSGLPQVIFLIEGDTTKDLYRCPADTMHSTLWDIRIVKENQVVQTAHMEETVQTLRRMHRRMLKRTFPSAFYRESLPEFAEPTAGGERRRQRDSFGEPHKRRRRRLESLHGLTFDEEPIPMAGMDRFVSYKELVTKVERDRELGRRTAGGIHQAMLKQVATISDTKIPPICERYPTLASILQAYEDAGDSIESGRLLMQDISTNPEGKAAARKTTIGAKSSAELYIAYGHREGDDSGEEDEARPSPRYDELVRSAQKTQRLAPISESNEYEVLQRVIAESLSSAQNPQAKSQRRKPGASNNTTTKRARAPATLTKSAAVSSQLQSTSALAPFDNLTFTSDEDETPPAVSAASTRRSAPRTMALDLSSDDSSMGEMYARARPMTKKTVKKTPPLRSVSCNQEVIEIDSD